MDRLLLIGPNPPPIGGVSVHLRRLAAMLSKNGINISFVDESPLEKKGIFNIRSLNIVKYIGLLWDADVVHVHSSVTVLRIFHLTFSWMLRKKVVVTIHSWRSRTSKFLRLQKFLLARVHKVICVNEEIAKSLCLSNSEVFPAFIPPVLEEERDLPTIIYEWVKARRKGGARIISSNAYRLNFHNGVDLYGLDMSIRMMENLVVQNQINVALVFVVATVNSEDKLFFEYLKDIERRGLSDYVLLINSAEVSFVKLIEISDLTIRATNTDGDALSVRESLYLNKPVIASNASARPRGVRLFKSRDQEDLNTVANLVVKNIQADVSGSRESLDYYAFYKSVYE